MADHDDKKPLPKHDTKRRLSRRNLLRRLGGQREDRPGAASLGFDALARDADQAIREQRYEQALALYERMVEREPAHREAWRYRGWCLLKLERFAEAQSVLNSLLQAHPGDGHGLLYLGLSHAMANKIDQALVAWAEYHDYSKVLILREINLIRFEAEDGESLNGPALARRIEDAIRRQEQA